MKRAFIAMIASAALFAACSSGALVVPPTSNPAASPIAAASHAADPSPVASVEPSPAPSLALGFVPGTKASPRAVTITVDDELTFFPNVITVAERETVSFAITNTGKAAHEFMLGPAADAMTDKEGTPEPPTFSLARRRR
jgi:hypothetical protein